METMKDKKWVISNSTKITNAERGTIGIYFLTRDGEIVYVGRSVNCIKRVSQHVVDGVKIFDGYTILAMDEYKLDYCEAHYIIKFNPMYNAILPSCEQYISANKIKSLTGLHLTKIRGTIRNAGYEPVHLRHLSYYDYECLDLFDAEQEAHNEV